jgi:hypothetical protein
MKYITQNYNNYLHDKKVVIVAPSRRLQGQGLGKWIDSFDIVVRMNHSLPISNIEDYGNKTDIIYNYLSNDRFLNENYINNLIDGNVKWITTLHWVTNIVMQFNNLLKNRINHLIVNTSFFQGINKTMVLAPQTGTVAIKHLLLTSLKSLNVVGYDYYQSGYVEGYKGLYGDKAINVQPKKDTHLASDQLNCIKNINDDRLILDDVLKVLIK